MSLLSQQTSRGAQANGVEGWLSDCRGQSIATNNGTETTAKVLRESSRIKTQQLVAKLQEDIEIQSSFHELVLKELANQI